MSDFKPPESKPPEETSVPPKADSPSIPSDASTAHKPDDPIASKPSDALPSEKVVANSAEPLAPMRAPPSITDIKGTPRWLRILGKMLLVLFSIALIGMMCLFGWISLAFLYCSFYK
jgi:hypothetical protein